MKNNISFPMDGITLQHTGELLFNIDPTRKERAECAHTYIRSLEDFCFAYTYGTSFAHTGSFPEIHGYFPGDMLCKEFKDRFETLDSNKHPGPEFFIDDPIVSALLIKDMEQAFLAYTLRPDFYKDWIIREAKAHLGDDNSLKEVMNPPDLYIFNKKPPYLKARELQSKIPLNFLDPLTEVVINSLGETEIKTNAVREFVSRSFLTHQVLYWWYNHLVGQNHINHYIQLPHITRSLLRYVVCRNAGIEQLKMLQDLLLKPALYDALIKSNNRLDLINKIKEQANLQPYIYLRKRIENLFEELEEKNSDKKIQKLLKEIKNYSTSSSFFDYFEDISFSLPAPNWLPVIGVDIKTTLFMPKKAAFRRIIKQYKNDDYYIRLSKIFNEFNLNKL